MSHDHDHGLKEAGDRRLLGAVSINLVLTAAQVIGGLLSGSLALIADALHNLSDAGSLVIALIARKIARRPASDVMTFGYGRAEPIAALINYTVLIVIGLYLFYQAVWRFVEPQPVGGWPVVIIAAIALAVDMATVMLTYAMSKRSMNIRAAFLHNLADAFASVGVIVAGTLILLFDWTIADPIVTMVIAIYVLYQATTEIGSAIRLLMGAAPPNLDVGAVIRSLQTMPGVRAVHHVHLWEIEEGRPSLEAHVIVNGDAGVSHAALKNDMKALLRRDFNIRHSTIELDDETAFP